nr:hypothetical protein [Tanacetum cinerariifolium]
MEILYYYHQQVSNREKLGYDSLRLSQAQIVWGLYHKRNVNFAYLMWEDFVYHVKHKDTKKSNEMYYPRFMKVIIHHFMSKDPSIPRRNKVNWHYVRDDHMFSTIKLVSKHQNTQQFDALLAIELTNEDIRNSNAYKEYYAVATGVTPPKPKSNVQKTRSSSDTTITPPTADAGPRLTTFKKEKQAAKASKGKSLSALSEVTMTEVQQLKLATKRSLQQTHISQASGYGADEGTGSIPGVPDVPTDDLSTHAKEEPRDEESFDPILKTLEDTDDEGNGKENLGINVGREEGHDEKKEEDELYRDVNINQGRGMESIFETTSQMDVQTPTSVAPLPISEYSPTRSTQFGLLFGFDHRLKTLEEQIKEQVKVQVSKILPKIEQTVNEQLEAKVLTWSSNSLKTSYVVATDLSEMELKKILIEKIEGNKSIHRSNEQRNLYKALVEAYESDKIILDTYEDIVTLKRRHNDDADRDEEPSAGSDRGSKRHEEGKEPESVSAPTEKATRSAGKSTQGSKSQQMSASDSATAEEPMQTTFEMEEPSHPEFETAGPTYELTKGSCKSLLELEYQLEEVYKATTDQLDWVNLEGQQYPHNLLKPLPLIPNNRGRRVIPFDHFINNDLEYLREGASSRKYTTSISKRKAADYGHIKWIEDLFYNFAVNQECARNVYSKRRIIAVTELKIVEWHNYKHLDGITVRRDDDKLYKFKKVEERFAFNVSLRMFTRSIIIQRCVEDLQLDVKSYQKKLNLTKPDTYRSDLKRKEAYIAYSNLRGFIYQNKDKKNRLMQIDELHKFSDGTLIDVHTALDDRLKGISMQYLPQSIWRKSDKDRAAAMIQAIDKRLKTRRIMRSLERFVGGRLYEGDFKMLQRTI